MTGIKEVVEEFKRSGTDGAGFSAEAALQLMSSSTSEVRELGSKFFEHAFSLDPSKALGLLRDFTNVKRNDYSGQALHSAAHVLANFVSSYKNSDKKEEFDKALSASIFLINTGNGLGNGKENVETIIKAYEKSPSENLYLMENLLKKGCDRDYTVTTLKNSLKDEKLFDKVTDLVLRSYFAENNYSRDDAKDIIKDAYKINPEKLTKDFNAKMDDLKELRHLLANPTMGRRDNERCDDVKKQLEEAQKFANELGIKQTTFFAKLFGTSKKEVVSQIN